MPRNVRGKAFAVMLMIAGLLVGVIPNAWAYQQVSDPDEALVEGDVKNIFWWDDATNVYLGLTSTDATLLSADAKGTWTFDLNASPATGGPDGVPGELCAKVKQVGANFQAELYAGCGTEAGNSYPVTQPSPDKVQFALPRSELVAAGLAAAATSYNFRVSNTNALNETDQVPDATTAVVTHTFGESPPPPPPPPGAQQASDEQGVNAGNPGGGVLTINAVQANVALGSAPPGSTKVAPVGDVDYTNSLASGNAWNVTVEATSLASGANKVHYANLAFAGGSTITQVPSGAGAVPTANTSEQAFGVATDPDPTPGQSYSTPVTIANAPLTTQGAFKQAGSTLKLTVPAAQPAGTYSGKLRYTITG